MKIQLAKIKVPAIDACTVVDRVSAHLRAHTPLFKEKVIFQAIFKHSLILCCGISNNLDGTEDDLVSDNFPVLDEDNLSMELGDISFDLDSDSDVCF